MKTVNKVMQDAIHGNSGKLWNAENIGLPEGFTPSNIKDGVETGKLSGSDLRLECFDSETFAELPKGFQDSYLERSAKRLLQYDVSTVLREIGNSENELLNERDWYEENADGEYVLMSDEEGNEIPFEDDGRHMVYIDFDQNVVWSRVYEPRTNKASEKKAKEMAQRRADCKAAVETQLAAVSAVCPDPLTDEQIASLTKAVEKSWGF
eukprot:GHVU01175151.1.p1 GENE.GHVU01175151.1~~GHVU01175151.1.p1  ORF type:complete len:208 (-),score=16.45 GHVU01175151.1:86-709(-)